LHIKEISDKIEICAYCPLMCQDICTVFGETKNQATCPTMQQFLLWLINEGKAEYSREVAEIMYECCCGCLLCQSWCATRQDVPEKVRAARMDLVELNLTPKPVHDLHRYTLECHNPYGKPHEERFKNVEGKPAHRATGAEILYFVGCTAAYRRPEIAETVIKVLESANLNFALMDGEEWCCGLPQWELGLEATAKALAEHNSNYINGSGCSIVITSCPECYYMLKKVYPSIGFSINAEVYHVSEYVNALIKDGKLSLKGVFTGKASYHDPCYLGRHMKVFDEPRELIKKIGVTDFVEMRWVRDKAYCCGGNIGFNLTHPELSSRIGEKIVEEAKMVDAELLITNCPLCKELLIKHAKGKGVKVYDLMEIIEESILK